MSSGHSADFTRQQTTERRRTLQTQLEAAYRRLNTTLNEADAVKLKRRSAGIEVGTTAIEAKDRTAFLSTHARGAV